MKSLSTQFFSSPSFSRRSFRVSVDGAITNVFSPSGWAIAVQKLEGDQVIEEMSFSGSDFSGTAPAITLMAAIQALRILMPNGLPITLISDSEYLVKGMNERRANWKLNCWKKADGVEVANRALWMQLDELDQAMKVEWVWVRGAAGHPLQVRAKQLCRSAIEAARDELAA